jgi:pimeloyl-ACP methyl ester carboxylesterase
MFGYHFEHDPLVTTYTPEGVGVTSKPISFELDGETVRGGIYSPKHGETDPNKLVIVCHGMWGSHRSYMQEIGFICSKGLTVLSFDYIGTASSDGKTLGGFGQSLRCLERAVRFVKESKELANRQIWVVGHSWGGYAASNIVAFHPDVKGVVAIAPAASYEAVIRNFFPKGVHFLLPAAKLTDRIKTGRFANRNATESLKNYNGRALFIHSKDDPTCPFPTTTGAIREKFGNRFDYIILEDKAHHPQYTYEGLAIMRDYSIAMKTLSTEDERTEYKKATDFLKMGALDPRIMNEITQYIKG